MGLGSTSGGGGMGDISDGMNHQAGVSSSNQQDMLDGFAGLDMSGSGQQQTGQQQMTSTGQPKQTNEDLLGLF